MIFRSFPVPPLGCNCSIIGDSLSKKAIVVDPGGDHEGILATLRDLDLTVSIIIHTHAHFDHFLASGEMHKATGAPLCLHRADQPLWENLELQCQLFDVPYIPVPSPNQWLGDGETLRVGNLAGDTLFRGSIGRTDLWGGDAAAIERSIKQRLYTLDESTRVITGHGPETTIGFEVRNNQFVRG